MVDTHAVYRNGYMTFEDCGGIFMFIEPRYVVGDIDLSNTAPDISDALLLFKYVAGLSGKLSDKALSLADIDGADGVTIGDALKLFRFVAGIDKVLG